MKAGFATRWAIQVTEQQRVHSRIYYRKQHNLMDISESIAVSPPDAAISAFRGVAMEAKRI